MKADQAAKAGVAAARLVAAGEPYTDFVLQVATEMVGPEARSGLVRWEPRINGGSPEITMTHGLALTPDEVTAAARAVPAHPSFAPGRPRTHRVSDRVVRMRAFWASDVWSAVHAPIGGRFPLSVPFVLTPHALVHLGVMRDTPDYFADEVEAFEVLARPVRAALAFRAALDDAVARVPTEPREDVRFTAREIDVLVLVAAGWTDGHIARRLGISEATVRQRLTTARDRVGALNRTHLVVRWLEVTGRVVNGHAALAWAADET